MNIILVIGLLTLSNSLCGHGAHDLSVSSTNSKEAIKFLCEIFPKILKSKCKFEPDEVENKFGVKDFFNQKIPLQINSNAEKSVNTIQSVPDNVISMDVTEETFQEFNSLCSIFPFPLKDSCTRVMSLKSQEDLENLLEILNSEGFYEIIETHFQEKLDSFQWYNISNGPTKRSVPCVICKLVAKQLSYILSRASSRKMIEKVLSKICNLIPSKWKIKCQKFISKYWNKLINFLLQRVTPDRLCSLIMLCSDNLKEDDLKIIENILSDQEETFRDSMDRKEIINIKEKEIQQKAANPMECLLCKTAMEQIIHLNGNDETERSLKNICSILPDSLREECQNLVNKHGKSIGKVDNQASSEICSFLTLCSTKDNTENDLSGG